MGYHKVQLGDEIYFRLDFMLHFHSNWFACLFCDISSVQKNIHYEMFCSCSITSWKISWFELEKLKIDKNQVYKKYCLRILTAAQYPIKVIWNYKAHSFWSVQILNSLTEHFRQLEIKPIRSRHRRCSRKFRRFHRKTPGWSIFIK